MAITVVNTTDTFEEWRLKTNQIAADLGDIDQLLTLDGAPPTNIVDEFNKLSTSNIALIVALG